MDGRTSCVPWADILKDPAGFIDPEYLPDYQTLDKEPSHLAIQKVKKLLNFWIARQRAGKTVFRFRFVIQGSEQVAAKLPDIRANTQKPSGRASKQTGNGKRHVRKSNGAEVTIDEEDVDAEESNRKGRKNTGKKSKKKGKKGIKSSDVMELSGEEFDLHVIDEMQFSDDDTPFVNGSGRSLGDSNRTSGRMDTNGPQHAGHITTTIAHRDQSENTTHALPAPTVYPHPKKRYGTNS